MESINKCCGWVDFVKGNDKLEGISTISLLFSHLAAAEALNDFLSFVYD